MTTEHQNWVLRSRRIVASGGVIDGAVVVRGETVDAIVPADRIPSSLHVEDVGNSVVMAGLVDTHVHIDEPGRTEWEGFDSATRAAAAGGVTTLVDMPLNCLPPTTTAEALQTKVTSANGKMHVDCGFHGGLIPGNRREIEALISAGVLGIKAFLVDSGVPEFRAVGSEDLEAAMPALAEAGIPLLVHAELPDHGRPEVGTPEGDPTSYATHLASRPPEWEVRAVELVLELGRRYACPIHIVHLSAVEALEPILTARREGRAVTVETCPHYLYFSSDEATTGTTLLKCAPPIRGPANRERLWQALSEGHIDLVVSDHSPAPLEMKHLDTGNFRDAWGGVASLQLGLPVVWTAARQRGIPFERIAEWMCAAPGRLAGLEGRKGRLAPGADADLVVWNPEASFVVTPDIIHHRHRRTPYDGYTLFGLVERTILRGKTVFLNTRFRDDPAGRVLLRTTSIQGESA